MSKPSNELITVIALGVMSIGLFGLKIANRHLETERKKRLDEREALLKKNREINDSLDEYLTSRKFWGIVTDNYL